MNRNVLRVTEKCYKSMLVFFVIATGLIINANAQTTRYAGTYNELTTAVTNSSAGDIISITANIVVSAQVSIGKSLTIYGNDYTITVPSPGLDEMGRFSSSASTFRVFYFGTAGTTITINNLKIKGGHVQENGAAIRIDNATATVKLNNCIISNSRAGDSYGGGGINNLGILFLNNCYLRRNAARYGGGMLNEGSNARAYIESSTMVENRTTSTNGGGGAIENKTSAKLYINNSTLSNNQSKEVGGAINNYTGTCYFVNSSATGNVVYGVEAGTTNIGGAIGNNGGYLYAVNALFAHNYRATTGTSANPGTYVLDDINAYSYQNQVYLYFCIYHATLPSGMGGSVSSVHYTGNMNGSDNTIFSDGVSAKLTDSNGTEIGESIFRPFLYENNGSVAPTLKAGSFVLTSANRGTRTRFANNNNANPVVAYYNGTSYVNLTGTSSSGQEVLVDQVGSNRPDPPARGAIEGVTTNLYMVKVLVSANGTVSGGTFYGDVYQQGDRKSTRLNSSH